MQSTARLDPVPGGLNAARVRADFPLLRGAAGGPAFHYLDNAATSQKPGAVLEALDGCYRRRYGPVHRGLYPLAEVATAEYERARATVARFLGAPAPAQLVFTRSATEAINLVACGWAEPRLRAGDEVWVSRLEHHSNFLPWQRACQRTGARLRVIELAADGTLEPAALESACGPNTRLIALTHVSNVLGVVAPVRELVARARQRGIAVLVDAAQSVAHLPIDIATLDCDFLACSAHKMCGPTGIGALYARVERLEEMEPLLLGGGMVDVASEAYSSWAAYPGRFEAGSPNLAGAIGFAAAADYLAGVGMNCINDHVQALTRRALRGLAAIPGVRIYGPAETTRRAGIVSFNLAGAHPHDVAQLLAERGVAIRAGHHCCQPLMRFLEVSATARASFALYNLSEDVDALIDAVQWARRVLA